MPLEDLQERKLQLEIDKLNSDIGKNNVSWYINSDFWKSVVPPFITTIAVLASLYFTVGKSVMDDEKRKLELQKEQLKLEVMQFEGVKQEIQKDITSFKIDKDALLTRIKILQNQKATLGVSVEGLKKNINSLNNRLVVSC